MCAHSVQVLQIPRSSLLLAWDRSRGAHARSPLQEVGITHRCDLLEVLEPRRHLARVGALEHPRLRQVGDLARTLVDHLDAEARLGETQATERHVGLNKDNEMIHERCVDAAAGSGGTPLPLPEERPACSLANWVGTQLTVLPALPLLTPTL